MPFQWVSSELFSQPVWSTGISSQMCGCDRRAMGIKFPTGQCAQKSPSVACKLQPRCAGKDSFAITKSVKRIGSAVPESGVRRINQPISLKAGEKLWFYCCNLTQRHPPSSDLACWFKPSLQRYRKVLLESVYCFLLCTTLWPGQSLSHPGHYWIRFKQY